MIYTSNSAATDTGTGTTGGYAYAWTTNNTTSPTGTHFYYTPPTRTEVVTREIEKLPPELDELDPDTYERLLEAARREKKIQANKNSKTRRKIQLK